MSNQKRGFATLRKPNDHQQVRDQRKSHAGACTTSKQKRGLVTFRTPNDHQQVRDQRESRVEDVRAAQDKQLKDSDLGVSEIPSPDPAGGSKDSIQAEPGVREVRENLTNKDGPKTKDERGN